MEEKITLTVSYENHTDVVLTNSNGDTYTSKSEELMDFLLSSENKNVNVNPTITDKHIQEHAEKYANEYQSDVSKPIAKEGFIEGAKWMQEQDRWISVNDRLPEFDVHVIVYCKIYGRYLASYRRIDADYNWGEWRDFNNDVCLPPTHWQPLPQPPKQD